MAVFADFCVPLAPILGLMTGVLIPFFSSGRTSFFKSAPAFHVAGHEMGKNLWLLGLKNG